MDPADSVVHRAMGLVDVMYSSIPHASGLGHVFCLRSIVMRPVEQLQSLAEAAIRSHVYIHSRMISEILTIINRGLLDLADGCIDLANRMFFVPLNRRPCNLVQVGAS